MANPAVSVFYRPVRSIELKQARGTGVLNRQAGYRICDLDAIAPFDMTVALDAKAAGIHWRAAVHLILGIDPEKQPGRSKRIWRAHLSRAEWMTREGYRYLLQAKS